MTNGGGKKHGPVEKPKAETKQTEQPKQEKK